MVRVILTAALVVLGASSAPAQGLLDLFKGGFNGSGGNAFWQGSWGTEGKTPVITINGNDVTYEGSNRQTYAVSMVTIAASKVTFVVGQADVALSKRADNNVDMVSTVGEHSSGTIVLCRGDAASCPQP